MRPHLILNPKARELQRRPELITELRVGASRRANVWITHSLGELEAAARRIAAERPPWVGFAGGDGTFMAGLSALCEAFGPRASSMLPPLALLSAGTVGTVARNWGPRIPLRYAVDALVSSNADPLPVRSRPTLQLEEDSGRHRYGFTFGTGLVARFFERYYRVGAGGVPTAARIFARVFVGSLVGDGYARTILDPLPCRVEVDQRTLPEAAFSLVLASVLPDVGLGMRLTHRAAQDPERPHVVVSALPPRRLGPRAPRVWLGTRERASQRLMSFDGLVGELRVLGSAGPLPYVFDGDLFSCAAVSVQAGPQIRVVELAKLAKSRS